jgi:class 3 adenylate cyclase
LASGLVSILFTDLVGSTELASEVGDTAADDLRRRHFADLREAIAATGGTEVKTIGDALMVSYSGAADAVAGAVAMQRAVERRNRSLEGHRLEMRVGVSVGDANFEEGDWFGAPVVEASRLCSSANGGQILVSELVRALAGSRAEFELRPLGTRELKGLPAPVAVCDVEWRVAQHARALPFPAFVDTAPSFPFAGRRDAFETLLTAWKESWEGARRAVLVSGEPGIGKTRLVTELVRHAHDEGTTILWGRCDEELGAPFEPFAEALRHYVHHVPADQLRAELGPLGGELTRVLPELSARVTGLAEPVTSDAETERHRLFEAVADLLGELSQASGAILVLDDVHWSDKPSLLLLRHVLRASTPMRLLVLCTYRDTDLDRTHPLADVLADLRRVPGVTRLDLDGLDSNEVTALMEATAGHELAAEGLDLAAAVHAETQGNPFFVGEVLLHLAESGAIVQRDGRWTSDLTLADVGIPEGIREVVGRRLSRLSDAANRALAVAAVMGATFDLGTIEAAGGPQGEELFDALDEAARHALVRAVPGAPGRYAFAHALVRSSLYEELSTNRRVRMHWQIACALETRYGQHVDEHLDELAHHFSEGALAGDAAKAVEYGRRAGARADDELAFEAAASHYESALGALELVVDADPALRCDLQYALALAFSNGSDARTRDAVFAAAATARALGDAVHFAQTAMVLSRGGGVSGAVLDPELVALLEAAIDLLGDEQPGLRARLLSTLAVELQWGREAERRMRLAAEALELARATRDFEAVGLVLRRSWALLDYSAPRVDEMLALYDEAEVNALETKDPGALWDVLRGRAYTSACRGDGAALVENLQAAQRVVDTMRRPRASWLMRSDIAALAAFHGELDRAEQVAMEAFALAQEAHVDDATAISQLGVVLYQVRQAQGRLDEMVPLLEARVEGAPDVPVWRVALAGALIESDQEELARAQYDWLTADGWSRIPPDVEYPVIMCGLARMAFRLRPSIETLTDVYERLLPFAGLFNWTGGTITDANDLGLAMAAERLGRPHDTDRHFTAAIALCDRVGARAYLARCLLDQTRVLTARGDSTGARESGERTIALATELGMTGPFGAVPRAEKLLASLPS